jgi:hypothetical protein
MGKPPSSGFAPNASELSRKQLVKNQKLQSSHHLLSNTLLCVIYKTMRAEALTSRIKRVPENIRQARDKIGKIIESKPPEIPASIRNLDMTWTIVGETILDNSESKKMNEVLAEVDAAMAISHEGINPENPVVQALWGDNPQLVPSTREVTGVLASSRARANDWLNHVGLLRFARVSSSSPVSIEARAGYKVTPQIRVRRQTGMPDEEVTVYIVEKKRSGDYMQPQSWSGFKVSERRNWKTNGQIMGDEERHEARYGYHRLSKDKLK